MMVLRKIVDTGVKLARLDKRGWDKLYFGIRQDIKLGIKHGFGAGSIIGDFLSNDSSNPFEDGSIPGKRPKYAANKFSQKYRRRSVPRRCRCNKYYNDSSRYRK